MFVNVSMNACVCVFVYAYARMRMHVCVCIYVCMYLCVSICICVNEFMCSQQTDTHNCHHYAEDTKNQYAWIPHYREDTNKLCV